MFGKRDAVISDAVRTEIGTKRSQSVDPSGRVKRRLASVAVVVGSALLLAGCAAQPSQVASGFGSSYDPRLGVSASPRMVADGEPVPKGGGAYLVGRPYVIGGREYVPNQRPAGYSAVGTASWYGDAFHGRRTANGEVFDKGSISAAHPTLPLPSYVRVTNTVNGRSMIVRVNDRGPYHGNRVMDVSQRVAEALDFRRSGTARIRIDYIGKANLGGSDDARLAATLRTDGQLAQLDGHGVAVADNESVPTDPGPAAPQAQRVARLNERDDSPADDPDGTQVRPVGRPVKAPIPAPRPFDMGQLAEANTERTIARTAAPPLPRTHATSTARHAAVAPAQAPLPPARTHLAVNLPVRHHPGN